MANKGSSDLDLAERRNEAEFVSSSPYSPSPPSGLLGRLIRGRPSKPPLVIDARKASDWEASPVQIQHSLRLDPEQLPKEFAGPKGRFIIVYCH